MNIIQLTPGTGNFHCGSCLRDRALVMELQKRGHHILMVPLYLPFVLDSPEVEKTPVFLGGINMFLQERISLFRKSPEWLDKLLNHPRLLEFVARHSGLTRPKDLGDLTVSTFKGMEGNQTKELEKLIVWLEENEKSPDLVCLSNGLLNGLAKPISERLGLPVVSTLQGEDTFLDSLPEPSRTESWQLFRDNSAYIERYLPVSEYYSETMQERLKIDKEKFTVAHNGIDTAHYRRALPQDPPVIGYLARMCVGKGLHTLINAFILLKEHGSTAKLKIAGAATRADQRFIEDQKLMLRNAGLENEVEFFPNLSYEEKIEFYRSLTVFSVPATYGESFGLYTLEAMASQVPIVQPASGAFPEILRETRGGHLCKPDSPADLAETIEKLLSDEHLRIQMARTGREKVLENFSAESMARRVEAVYESVVNPDSQTESDLL